MKELSRKEQAAWRRLMDAWNRGELACALELARAYTRDHADNPAGWVALGSLLVDLARYDEALPALRRAARLLPEKARPLAWAQMGHLYMAKGNYGSAEKWYRRAVDAKAKTSVLIFLGALYAKQGRFADAKRCYRRAIRRSTEPPDEAHANLGLVLRAEGRYREAIEHFDEAIAIDSEYTLAREARKDCERALKGRAGERR